MPERYKQPEQRELLCRHCEVCNTTFETRRDFERGCDLCREANPYRPLWLNPHFIE